MFVEQNKVLEVSFESAKTYGDPFNEVQFDVSISEPGGHAELVPGFWAGGNAWRFRFATGQLGHYRYATVCSNAEDPGLHGVNGEFDVVPGTGANPLQVHGPVRVAENKKHFEHADGTPFFWLGDTWWMGLCHRLHFPDEFDVLTRDRVEKGFTVVQIVAGLYPDMPPFDPRGANEAGFPWEADYARIRPEYFDAADQRLNRLVDAGIAPCIVGAWGYFMPWMGQEKLKQHWRYLIARYGALPVFWCIAGEANLPYYLTEGFPFDDRKQATEWTEVTRYVRATDPFRRPITIHPTGMEPLSSKGATDDASLLDFDLLQTGHGGPEILVPSMRALKYSLDTPPAMPVLNGEVSYEMLMDKFTPDAQRMVFWASMLSGAAGQTYGGNGIWQCNRKGEPHGKSPHGGTYGVIPWDEAMRLPGSSQLGLAKKLLEQYSWQRFEPHPEWAEVVMEKRHPKEAEVPETPYAAGIPDLVRVIYMPVAKDLAVRELGANERYTAFTLDPVSGLRNALGPIESDGEGRWVCRAPEGMAKDWVLVLERTVP